MGKHFLSSVQFQHNYPGCMWGILHILDYHHWHNVKKVLPHRKHYGGRLATYRRKAILYYHGISEDQKFTASETEPLLTKQHSRKVGANGKRSPRRCKKESHIEDGVEEENSKGRILSFPAEAEPQNLESSKNSMQCKASGITNSNDYSRKNQSASEYTEAALNQKFGDASMFNSDISNKLNEHTDVLEVFRVEKDLLLKILQDVGGKSFQHASNNKARLTKSGSFPLAKSSQVRDIGSTSLNHKKNEVWAFPKGEKSLTFTSHSKKMSLVTDHDVDGGTKDKPSVSSSGSSHGFNHRGWNQLVLHRFKAIKQKIKQALVEFTRNGYQNSIEAIQHRRRASSEFRLPSKNVREASQSLDDGMAQVYIESRNSLDTKASDYDSYRHEVGLMRRTSSLNESLDRYTQLFEESFRKDMKWHNSMSKSSKVTNEDKSEMSGHAPKFSRRNLSLPNLDPLGFLLHEAIRDTNDLGIPVTTSVENNINAELDIHVQQNPRESEIQEVVDSGDNYDVNPITVEEYEKEVTIDNGEGIHEPAMEDGKDELAVLETTYEDDAAEEIIAGTETNIRAKGTNKSGDINSLLSESDIEDDLNFKYVIDVIELWGFMDENECIKACHADQPLKSSLFKELEACLHKETECSEEETSKNYDHQLLFNLVNEVLHEIHERSSTYFPMPFSFNPGLRPVPKGQHLLKQVWSGVDSFLRLKPELDQTLDDVVSRDLALCGWMNLQWEEECVALQLEDMIVEDLLNQVIFSWVEMSYHM